MLPCRQRTLPRRAELLLVARAHAYQVIENPAYNRKKRRTAVVFIPQRTFIYIRTRYDFPDYVFVAT